VLTLRTLTKEAFAPYGLILQHGSENPASFQVIARADEPTGWQLAVSRVVRGVVTTLACHPNTMESFTPLAGVGALVVAASACPQEVACFLLDRPVCLHKGTWHCTLAVTDTATFVISENRQVESESYSLPQPLVIGLGVHSPPVDPYASCR